MLLETSRLSPASSFYSTALPTSKHPGQVEGTVILNPHKGWLLIRYWIHIAAITITAGLAAINILNVYLMDSDYTNTAAVLNAFQFAAKLHEVLIVGSLMLVMMDTVRSRLVSSRGVPFGYLLAPILFNDLDWLISHQFWTSMKPTRSTFGLTALVLTSIPFANIAGPLSAITVVPRLGWSIAEPAAVYATFWNSSAAAIWPSRLAAASLSPSLECSGSAGQTDGCPGSALKTVSIILDSTYDLVLCTKTQNRVSCNTTSDTQRSRQLSMEYDTDSLSTFSSTPNNVIFQTLMNRFSAGIASGLELPDTVPLDAERMVLIETAFLGNTRLLKPITNTTCKDLTYEDIYQTFQDFEIESNFSSPTVHWLGNIDSSLEPSFLFTYLKNDSSLDAATDCEGQACFGAVQCVTDARWMPVSLWYNSAQISLYQSDPQPQKLFESSKIQEATSITIEKGWLEVMKSQSAFSIHKAFREFLNDRGVPMSGSPPPISDQARQGFFRPSNYSQAISFFLGGVLTEALAANADLVGQSFYSGDCTDTTPGFTFSSSICDQDPSFWIRAKELGSLEDSFSMAAFTVRSNGYGWFIDSLTVKIALGILLFHSLLTVVHLISTLILRRTITACWSSAPEMLMLAVNSLRAPVLMGSSAKAADEDLWREPVSVMEVEDGEQVSLIVGDPFSYPERLGGPPRLGKKYL